MEFVLRPWQDTDVPAVARYADNRKIAANLRDGFPHPYTWEDAVAFVQSMAQDREEKQYLRAIAVEGEAVGSIGVFLKDDVYCKCGELGYWLAEPYWGRGIMSEAVRQLCGEVFRRYGLERIYAEPYAHNTGSRRVLEKVGFVLEGILRRSVYKNGVVYDGCMYSLLRGEHR